MSDCLHCDINDIVQERIDGGNTDIAALAAMVAESLVDLILLAPAQDQAAVIADALAHFGQVYLEKTGVTEGGSSATH